MSSFGTYDRCASIQGKTVAFDSTVERRAHGAFLELRRVGEPGDADAHGRDVQRLDRQL